MRRLVRSFRSWIAGRTVATLLCVVTGAIVLGVALLVICIALELGPGYGVACVLATVLVVTVFGIELLDRLDRRRRETP